MHRRRAEKRSVRAALQEVAGRVIAVEEGGGQGRQQAFAVHDLNHVMDTYLPEKLARAQEFLPLA